MTTKQSVDDFLSQTSLALVGVSRSGKKFGNTILKELLANGYRVTPVHPTAATIAGLRCAPSLAALPEPVGGVVTVVPPAETERVVEEAHAAGIRRVFMQQGSSSEKALRFCAEHGMEAISGECLLMFLRKGPAIHRVHRWWKGVFRALPA